jgi:hypothetical protein
MSDAFKCDDCEDFYDGRPAEKLYVKTGARHDTTLRAELCDECSESFAGGPPEP